MEALGEVISDELSEENCPLIDGGAVNQTVIGLNVIALHTTLGDMDKDVIANFCGRCKSLNTHRPKRNRVKINGQTKFVIKVQT
jgi:hypothetical protein